MSVGFNRVLYRVLMTFGGIVVFSIVGTTTTHAADEAATNSQCPTGFANFGDSLTDTGNALDAYPFYNDPENLPYGSRFFNRPAKRFSNGRLVPDFFSLAFRKPLLDGYFATTSFNYRFGVNFAVAAATAILDPAARVPFSLVPFQIAQFKRFKKNALQDGIGCGTSNPNLPIGNPYPNWLFTIESGGNDLLATIRPNGTPMAKIRSTVVPEVIGNITIAINTLYNLSARHFLVFNVPVQGCATNVLTLMRNLNLTKDSLGCIVAVNELVQGFNDGLMESVRDLRRTLPNVTISVFDYYGANLEILSHPARYGFDPKLTTTACCGAPGVGALNYNPSVTCGHPGAFGWSSCAKPDEYVNWDGVHFTEQFYRVISEFALRGKFTDQGINYAKYCDLDFSKFGSEERYSLAPSLSTCNEVFGSQN